MKNNHGSAPGLAQVSFGVRCGLMGALLVLAAGAGLTGQTTGNPIVDGWGLQGGSLAFGTFVRETASWNFSVFSSAFILRAGNPLANGTTWRVGDQILGMGGVVNGAQPIMPRFVAKFGTSAATFAPASAAATNLPPALFNDSGTVYGNGTGSFSAAGTGGFMVTYGSQSDYPSYALDPASQNGAVITPVPGNLYTLTAGGQQALSSGDFGRVIPNFQTNSLGVLITQNDQHGNPSSMPVLQTFEVLLNLDDLARAGYTLLPSAQGKGIMTLQFKTSSYTDGYVGQFAVSQPTATITGPAGVLLLR